MEYSPKNDNKKTATVTTVLYALSAVLYCFSTANVKYPGAVQLMAVCSAVAATYVLVRYSMTRITYSVRPREGAAEVYGSSVYGLPPSLLDFAVTKAQGKRPGAMECLLGLELLADVLPYKGTDTAEALRKRYSGLRFYHYTVSMSQGNRLALVFDDSGTYSAVIIEPSEELEQLLMRITERNQSKAGL